VARCRNVGKPRNKRALLPNRFDRVHPWKNRRWNKMKTSIPFPAKRREGG